MEKQSLQDMISAYRQNLLEAQQDVTEQVFASGDINYISAYEAFVDHLSEAAQKGNLSGRLENLTKSLQTGFSESSRKNNFYSQENFSNNSINY